MQAQPVSATNRRRPAIKLLLGLLISALLLGALVVANQFVGPAYQERQQTVSIMKQEAKQLPSYDGVQPDQLIIRNEPFGTPSLISTYHLSSSCENLQHYYASVAPTMKWVPRGGIRTYPDPLHPNDTSRDLLHSEYTKIAQSTHLLLVIECYVSATGYSLDMRQT